MRVIQYCKKRIQRTVQCFVIYWHKDIQRMLKTDGQGMQSNFMQLLEMLARQALVLSYFLRIIRRRRKGMRVIQYCDKRIQHIERRFVAC